MPMMAVSVVLTVLFALAAIAAMVLLRLTDGRATRRPARLELGDRAFLVLPYRPAYVLRTAVTVAVAGLVVSLALGLWLGVDGTGHRPSTLVPFGIALALCAAVLARLAVRSRQPALVIEPAGLRSGRRTVTWTALTERRAPYWVPIPTRSGRNIVEGYATNPAYVMAIVDHYCRTPGARPYIGDPAELARVHAVITGPVPGPFGAR
jgi:hypothetical protein